MIEKLSHTTSSAVARRLVALREEAGANAFGRVLTLLVCVTSPDEVPGAIKVAEAASYEHPCRVIVVVEGLAQAEESRVDAEIRFGEDAGPSDVVALYPYGGAGADLDSLVAPLVLPDTPVVAFWPGEPPVSPSEHPLGKLALRRITDTRQTDCPVSSLRKLAATYVPGDTDLAWSSVTLWRALLASIAEDFTQMPTHIRVTGHQTHPSSFLIATWLQGQSGIPADWEHDPSAETVTGVHFDFEDGSYTSLTREAGHSVAYLARTGLDTAPVNLPRRSVEDCLMEELRRLAPDTFYGRILDSLIGECRV